MKASVRVFFKAACWSLILGLVAPLAVTAQGPPADEPRRAPFVIFSDDPTLKAAFGVRHTFPGKFTANLTLAQAHRLERSGIKTEPVLLYNLAPPPGACSPWPECKNGDEEDSSGSSRVAFPDDQTPWGIETIYNDSTLSVTSGGSGVRVAVLDTGAYRDHIDLVNRVAQCVDFTGGPPGQKRIREGVCEDKNGHGTHVSGTILADGGSDGQGIFGVAPEASLLAYKVCTNSGCWTDDIAAAIDYAGDASLGDADIVSMSLGGDSESKLISEAIERNPDLLYVAAAGNDGPDEGSIDWPGANAVVVAVGAIDVKREVPSWSSRGINDGDYEVEAREVEHAAPGVSVESTWNDGGYRYISGTSMATPHVTGLAAREWMGSAGATRDRLHTLATDIWTEGDDPATGWGLPQLP